MKQVIKHRDGGLLGRSGEPSPDLNNMKLLTEQCINKKSNV